MKTSLSHFRSLTILVLMRALIGPVAAEPTAPSSEHGDAEALERIICTQGGVPIISLENVDGVTVDKAGAWPIINFRLGPLGPARSIGLNSPTLICMSRPGLIQGALYQKTGAMGGADLATLTCLRKGEVIFRRRVSHLKMSWAGSKMTLAYHLPGENEGQSTLAFDVTWAACLVEAVDQEVLLPQPGSPSQATASVAPSAPAVPPPAPATSPATSPVASGAAAPPEVHLMWPVKGRVVSGFGPASKGLHDDGIDIGAPQGTPVRSAAAGVVAYAGSEFEELGNLLLIRHADGITTAYAHNEKLLVARGDEVKKGQAIATVGKTGDVNTPQLHFEVRVGTRAVNPMGYLPQATETH